MSGQDARGLMSAPYKLLAVDLDGTLLDPSGRPHARDVEALRTLAGTGVAITIITGRLYSGTRHSAEVLGLAGPVACVDGSHVVSAATHTTLFHRGIRGDAALRLRDCIERHGPAAFLFAGDAVIHDAAGAPYVAYVTNWSNELTRVESVIDDGAWKGDAGVTAVVGVGTMEQIVGAAEDIGRDLAGAAQVATFPTRQIEGSWGMVVRAAGGDKGSALAWIANHHGIPMAQTVAVGDWINDVPMLAAAGRSFAMGQALPEVRQAATDVLEETVVEGGGIARAIELAFG